MKFELDENLGQSVRRRLTAAGHDVPTIVDQQMAGEGRVLVTLSGTFTVSNTSRA